MFMKKIYITEKQLKEALGLQLSYLDNNENGSKSVPYDSEISINGDLSRDSKTTTDKITSKQTPRSYFGARKRHATINCNTNKNNSLINESNKDLQNKLYTIPDYLYNKLKINYNKSKNKKNVIGFKRLENLISNRDIKNSEMYRLKNHFSKIDKNNGEYFLLGGDEMERWIEQQLNIATSASKHSKDVKHDMGIENAYIKTHTKNSGNGMAHTKKNNKIQFNYE